MFAADLTCVRIQFVFHHFRMILFISRVIITQRFEGKPSRPLDTILQTQEISRARLSPYRPHKTPLLTWNSLRAQFHVFQKSIFPYSYKLLWLIFILWGCFRALDYENKKLFNYQVAAVICGLITTWKDGSN